MLACFVRDRAQTNITAAKFEENPQPGIIGHIIAILSEKYHPISHDFL
jgi:hypothetical protein